MNILFTICGRAGSKGIKNKNIRNFLGIPLPLYTLAAVDLYMKKNSEIIGKIAINTDSQELVHIISHTPIKGISFISRKDILAADNASKIDVISDTLKEMEQQNRNTYDMVVDLDITSPLRTVRDLESLINVQRSSGCDVTFSVTQARRNPYFNMVKQVEKGYSRVISSSFVARQSAPEVFDMNASLYAYNPSFLKSGKQIFDGYCEIIQMRDTAILDLDHESDFELMEVIARHLYAQDTELNEIRTYAIQLDTQQNGRI